jgi:5-formyltetrahydrofolate cyclo-ligase
MKTEPSLQVQKSSLRQTMRRKRARVDDDRRRAWDAEINRHLLDYVHHLQPAVLAAYAAFDGEPALATALPRLEAEGVQLTLPVIHDEPGRSVISFRQWTRDSAMRPNRFGIPEPVGTEGVPLAEIDLVLLPLVAWDESGGRLGMGASFYDRLFQGYAEQDRPVRIGVAYELQKVERVPQEPWDVTLHGVLTEHGCFTCRA